VPGARSGQRANSIRNTHLGQTLSQMRREPSPRARVWSSTLVPHKPRPHTLDTTSSSSTASWDTHASDHHTMAWGGKRERVWRICTSQRQRDLSRRQERQARKARLCVVEHRARSLGLWIATAVVGRTLQKGEKIPLSVSLGQGFVSRYTRYVYRTVCSVIFAPRRNDAPGIEACGH
jgi:hypothetical protein